MKKYWDKFSDNFGSTIIHPQFIINFYKKQTINEIQKYSKNKKLIDIGAGRMPYRNIIENTTKKYIAVDHPHISNLYNSNFKIDIYADITKKIPVKNNEFDVAIMLEVLEYLENPEKTFSEIKRILKPKGVLIITSPFMYPLHDLPYDKNRFTFTRIENYLNEYNFKVKKIKSSQNFLGFWFLSLNVYLLKRIMDIIDNKKTFMSLFALLVLIIFTPFIVITTNCIFLPSKSFKNSYQNYFPIDYLIVAIRQ